MELILDHYSNPRNYGIFADADVDMEGSNPGCGDVIRMQARVNQVGAIYQVGFTGNGCTVSMASASVLTTLVQGLSLEEVVRFSDSRLYEMLSTSLSPRRLECMGLGLRLLRKGLVEYYHARRTSSEDVSW